LGGVKSCIDECTRKERNGIILLKVEIWKLRGIRRGFDGRRCPLGLEVKDAMLLKCPETKNWRGESVCSKWLNINEDTAYRKIISCTNN
jgi:hypothetical protein